MSLFLFLPLKKGNKWSGGIYSPSVCPPRPLALEGVCYLFTKKYSFPARKEFDPDPEQCYLCSYHYKPIMPTFITGQPKGPAEDRTVDDALAFGKQQWSAVWAGFARQWSQPALIKLAEATLGTKAIHSSQIHGFTTGKLRDPSPKLMMALGELNLAIAKANGEAITSRYTCPGTLAKHWQHKTWLRDAQGAALGPAEVFQAITGMIDLQVNLDRVIPSQVESDVSQALGKTLRMELAKQGIDWLDEIMTLKDQAPCIEALLMGKEVRGSEITEQLDQLAKIADMNADQLWGIAVAPHLS